MNQKMLLMQLLQMLNVFLGIFVIAILIDWFLDTLTSIREELNLIFFVNKLKDLDVFMISESKLDYGFHMPFRFDRNKNGGRILLYVREDITAKI